MRRTLPPVTSTPFDLGQLSGEDPYSALTRLRRHDGPVARIADRIWAVTGYDAAMETMRHRVFTSGPIGAMYRDVLPPGAARDEMSNRVNFLDPPDHTRVRGIVSKAFTPRRIADLRPWITSTARELVANVDATRPFDLLTEVAHVLPSLVISELLGVPNDDRDQLTMWSDEVTPLLSASPGKDAVERAIGAAEEFHAYLGALLDERRAAPGTDLLSALLAAEEDGERLHRVELLSLAATLYSAGHRTTRDLFTNGMATLLEHGGNGWRRFVAGEWDAADVAGEMLRHQTPTHYVGRVPCEPVELGGQRLDADEVALVFLGAANRDPEAYDAPDEFRPGRAGPPPVSFAYGPHYCLGASLARTEIEVLLETVASEWPNLQLVDETVHWHLRGPFRGVDALVVAP